MTTKIPYSYDVANTSMSERLRQAVERSGISLARAADLVGVSEQQFRRYLKDETPDLKLVGALRFCRATKTDPWFLGLGTAASSALDEDVILSQRMDRLEQTLDLNIPQILRALSAVGTKVGIDLELPSPPDTRRLRALNGPDA